MTTSQPLLPLDLPQTELSRLWPTPTAQNAKHATASHRKWREHTRDRRPAYQGIDVICGGFPCQDISIAGKGAGITGERSGLWTEYARIIGEVRPRYAIIENVAALLSRGLGDVLCDLSALGYDAEWHCIPASAVGAPHRRDRVWIVADADQPRLEGRLRTELRQCASERIAGQGSAHRWDEQRWFAESGMGRISHGISRPGGPT